MVQVLKDNQQFILILLFWTITGMYAGPLVFGIVPLFVLVMFKKGFYSELLIGFWFIIILSDSYSKSLVWAKDLKSVYILLLAFLFFTNQKLFQPINKFYLVFIPFFVTSLISIILYSPIVIQSFQKFFSYLLLIILIPNYLYLAFKTDGDFFFKKQYYLIVFILLIGLVFKYINPELAYIKTGRFRGVFGNPNGLGLFCFTVYTFFTILTNLKKDLFTKHEKIILYLLIFISLIWSGSRTNTIAIIIFSSSIFAFKIHFLIGLFFIIISFLGYELIGNNYVAIIQTLGLEDYFRLDTLNKGGGRYVAWEFVWNEIQKNYFMGKGFAWDEILMKQSRNKLYLLGHDGNVHNSFLTFWLNSGLIGLVLYMLALMSKIINASLSSNLVYPYLFSVLFTANFESWLVASLNPYTIIFVMVLTILNNIEYFSGKNSVENESGTTIVSEKIISL